MAAPGPAGHDDAREQRAELPRGDERNAAADEVADAELDGLDGGLEGNDHARKERRQEDDGRRLHAEEVRLIERLGGADLEAAR